MSQSLRHDTLWLEQIVILNALDVRWFLPFAVFRLAELSDQRTVDFSVFLYDITGERFQRRLQLHWRAETPSFQQPPIQPTVLTEFAACAIAFAVLPFYTQFYVTAVVDESSRFDYWVTNGERSAGLEVSGMQSGNTQARRRQKVQQFRSNPVFSDGYVCVLNFAQRAVHLSYHAAEQQ